MKKLFFCAGLLVILFSACRKKDNNPSTTITASYATVTFANNGLFAIPVGGSLPTGANFATAYDSFYKKEAAIAIFQDTTINFLVPGLYAGVVTGTTDYGYVTYDTFFVAVTQFPASGTPNLSGVWKQVGLIDSFNTLITPLSNGYYSTNNLLGTENFYGGGFPGVIVPLTDSTFAVYYNSLYFEYGYTFDGILSLAAGDTTMTYNAAAFGGGTVTYTKN